MRQRLRALNRRRAPCRLLCSFRLPPSEHFAPAGQVPTGHTRSCGVLGSRRPGRVGRCRIPIPDQLSLVGLFIMQKMNARFKSVFLFFLSIC